MIINLADPFWSAILAGIVLAIILGTHRFVVLGVTLKKTNEQYTNVLSELYSLQGDYEKEISKINKDKKQEIEKTVKFALDFVSKRVDEIIKHNRPPLVKPKTFLEAVLNANNIQNRKKDF